VRLWDPRQNECINTLYGTSPQTKVRQAQDPNIGWFGRLARRRLRCTFWFKMMHRSVGSAEWCSTSGWCWCVQVSFNRNGWWLLTAGHDSMIKMWDLRVGGVRELMTLRGHRKEITSLAWHPVHETLLASGDREGVLMYWITE
jgi:WD40 repeat protein